jgi:carbon storage regulator
MLILTRRPVETIYIGDEVTVTVLGVVGNQVRFGIEAPRSIVIDRAEIHERKKRTALASHPSHSDSDATEALGPNGNVLEPEAEVASDEVHGNRATEGAGTLKLRR